PAARAGHAEARPGVQSCDPHGTAAVPVAARGAGGGDRPVDAARRPGPRLAVGGAGRARLPRGVLRDPVVLHRVSAQSAQPHLSVRRRSLGLFEPPGAVALPLLARRDRSGDAARAGDRRGAGRGLRAAGVVVGELDDEAAAMTRLGLRLGALVGIGLVALAHVGSPDTYFEGAAGPYPVRVVVRNPGVVPGLAQITVRLLAPHAVRRVLVLPVYWDPKTAAPPPPDVAARVPGDATLYSTALWLMLGGSYSVQVTVEGEQGSGAVLVPVMAVATQRLVLDRPLGAVLLAFGGLLVVGALTLIGAAVKESVLEPGAVPDRRRTLHARIAMTIGAVVLA